MFSSVSLLSLHSQGPSLLALKLKVHNKLAFLLLSVLCCGCFSCLTIKISASYQPSHFIRGITRPCLFTTSAGFNLLTTVLSLIYTMLTNVLCALLSFKFLILLHCPHKWIHLDKKLLFLYLVLASLYRSQTKVPIHFFCSTVSTGI